MLQGGKEVDTTRFDSRVFDELAIQLDPDSQDIRSPEEDAKYRAYDAILELCKSNPRGYSLILAYLAELSRGYADKCANINPEADPVGTHGRVCFNSGAAWAYAEAASSLNPQRISQKLAAIRSGKSVINYSLDGDEEIG